MTKKKHSQSINRTHLSLAIAAWAIALVVGSSIQAAPVVSYDFSTDADPNTELLNTSSSAVTGVGFQESNRSSFSQNFFGRGIDINALTDYMTFTITADSGFTLSLDQLDFNYFIQQEDSNGGSNAGDFTFTLKSSADGFTSGISGTWNGVTGTSATVDTTASGLPATFDLTGGSCDGLSSIEFRLYMQSNDGDDRFNDIARLDDIVVLGDVSSTGPDLDPPTWIATWPQVDGVSTGGATVRARINEAGTAYFVVLADGATAPNSAEVKAGTGSGGSGELASGSISLTVADTENTDAITGLAVDTAYDVWFVAEDDEASPNLQASPQKVDITTASTQSPTRIMCVGDSITEGQNGFFIYRPDLNSLLLTAGHSFEFVGSKTNTRQGVTLKHEGYSGSNATQIASNLATTFPSNIADIVLIHAGHNYFADVQGEASIVNEVETATRSMISTARTHNPDVIILLAQVITSSKLPKYSYIPALNIRLAEIAAELNSQAQPVIIVNQADGWDPVADTVADEVHPTQAGATKMANKWFVALNPILGGVSSDTTAPSWTTGYPQVDGVTSSGATARAAIDENGTAFYVIVADGATAPTAAEVKAGTGSAGSGELASGSISLSAADTEATAAITGLTPGTSYDVYFVAEDDEGTPNLQANPAPVIDITTQVSSPTLVSYDFSTDASPTVEALYTSSTDVTGTGWDDGDGRSSVDGGNYYGRGPSDAAADSYLTFTVTPEAGLTLNLAELTFNYGAQADGDDYLATFTVRTSVDGYTVELPVNFSANPVASHSGTPIANQTATVDLSAALYDNLSSVTFRLCVETDEPSNSNQILRWDNIVLTGEAGAIAPGPPTLDNIVDNQGGGPIQANTRVTYTLTFSESIQESTLTTADFANAGTATIAFGAITETFPGIFTLDVIPSTAGTLQLSVPPTASILDVTGDALDSDPAIVDADTLNVTADTAAPTLAGPDIVDNRGGGPISTSSPVTYTVSFNEDIDGATVDAGDFDNAGSSTIIFGPISEIHPGVFSVEVTPTTAGTLQLRIPTTATINDTAGFALDSDPAIVDDTTLTVSDLPPVLVVSLNQIGYQTDAPKRFTAVDAPDGTPFTVTSEADPSTVHFSGTVTGNLGDFSAFQPVSPGPYVVNSYPPAAAPGISHPFLVQDDLIESKLVVPCIQFMVDSRSGVGTHPSAYGGNPWRDGTFYSFEIPSLIYLHLNAPGVSGGMTGEVDYDADKALALDPNYASSVFVNSAQDAGFVAALQRYYNDYDPPLPGCPDALKAMHFGLGVTMERPNTKDPSGGPPEHLHSQTREWFAWFLYTWPAIRNHLPDSFYLACRDFTFANWATSDLSSGQPSPLDIDPKWDPAGDPFKGRHAPGHSILPNLLLWQVALREGRSDANTYLTAAQAQTQWIIDNLDWSIPATTKGHRMSEQKMMTGLVHFLRNHPAEAPAGLATKIEDWVDTMIGRSDNLWDFRRYELTDTDGDGVVDWTLPRRNAKWNEPGNLAGFPACALAAAWTLDHAPAKQQRLRELSQSAIDCLFGRNPLNTGSASRPELGFPDQETSWTPSYSGAAGWLEGCRGKLASGPGSEHFPNNPTAEKRWNEGWVNFNAALNMGVSYMLADRSTDPQPLAAPFPLEISEILAQPAGDPLAEFVELHNPTALPVRLAGLSLAGDVTFTIPVDTADLAAGQRCLIVRDLAAFEAVHGTGLPVVGVFAGDLDDNGALLEVGDVNGNTFLAIDGASLPRFLGHSSTAGLGGWRLSAHVNGSPGTSDSVAFTGDPSADADRDGIPDLINHAVTGIGQAYASPRSEFVGAGVTVWITRNLAADDTVLTPQWSTDLDLWQDFAAPESETPSGGGLAEWTFEMQEISTRLFVRLRATQRTTQ